MMNKLFGMLCFLSPFLIGYGLYVLFQPVGFWQTIAWFIVAGIVCFFEGVFAWMIGIVAWDAD